jgi:hypothetical protein
MWNISRDGVMGIADRTAVKGVVLSLLAGYRNVFLKQKQNRFGRSVKYHSTKNMILIV